MVSINTNLSSLIVQNSLNKSTNALNRAIERMTTGYKINGAKDNAAGYSIVQDMSSKISSYEVAESNAAMGLDLLSTASDNLDLIQTHLSRIRDLAEQAANGTYGTESLQAIQSEVDARLAEIDRIMANTEYNGINLLSGAPAGSAFVNPVTRLSEEEALAQGYTLVKTVEDLNHILATPGDKYILMNDIYASEMEHIEPDILGYNSELNGNGYTIKASSSGIIIDVSNDATVKNLVFDLSSSGSHYGFNAYDNATFYNCSFISSESTSLGGANARECINVYQNDWNHTNVLVYYDNTGTGTQYTDDEEGWSHGYHNPEELPENLYNFYFGEGATSSDMVFQVGINGDSSSQISVNTSFSFNLSVDVTSHSSAMSALGSIDSVMKSLSNKQTQIGAAQNRLESVLESISVSYENLISSRSTMRDADVATESSAYIRSQILQQASATLLATANQSPSIALQLI